MNFSKIDVRWRYGALIAAAFGVSIVIIFVLSNIFDQKRFIEKESKANIWFVAQAEFEYQRLMTALHLFAVEGSAIEHGELMDRFEIFWSRLPLLKDGDQGQKLGSVAGLQDTVELSIRVLRDTESDIRDLVKGDLVGYRKVAGKLDQLKAPLQDMMLAGLNHDNRIYSSEREALSRLFDRLMVYLIAVAIAVVVIFLLFYREIGRAQLLAVEAQDAKTNADSARLQLSTAIESVSEGFILYDDQDRVVLHNSRYREFYPYQVETLNSGGNFKDLIECVVDAGAVEFAPETAEEWMARRQDSHAGTLGAFQCQMSDGRWIDIKERKTQDAWTVGVHSDITELKQRQTQLAGQTALLQATLENMNQGICVYDLELRLLAWNSAYQQMFDLPEGFLVPGRSCQEVFRFYAERGEYGKGPVEEIVERESKKFSDQVRTSQGVGKSERIRPDGSVIEIRWSKMPDGGLVESFLDISDRVRAEKERSRLLEQFHAAQKMEAMGTMAGGIAHDFNNILGAILGNADLLLDELPSDGVGHQRASQIIESGLRAKELISQILSYSRNEESVRGPVRLDIMIDEVVDLMRATLPSMIKIEKSLRSESSILADTTQVHQVLVNLCINASHAIGDRPGRIEVGVSEIMISPEDCAEITGGDLAGAGDASWISISTEGRKHRMYCGMLEPGSYVQLKVADTGSGIESGTMTRIFEPFFTTKDVGQGSGLGLAAVQGIVASHGGAIVVDSTVGQGTAFMLRIPKLEALERPLEPKPVEVSRPCGPRQAALVARRILIVDDDRSLLEVGRATLARAGYQVVAINDSDKALSAFRATPEAFDLIITDRTMPGMSGESFAQEIMRIRDSIPVIMCTGFVDSVTEDAVKQMGVREILIKPVFGRALSAAVERTFGAQ